MDEKDLKVCAEVFLEKQRQLFDAPVAENLEEAEEFLEDCMAEVFDDIAAVKEYFEEAGMDIAGLEDVDILEQMEVFELPDGRIMVVEA